MLVAILGASDNPDRYSNRAQQQLVRHGHQVIPVTPVYDSVLGETAVDALAAIDQPVDTVTMYLRPDRQAAILDDLVQLRPRRVIFNPGTENPAIEETLQQAGIHTERACTLVLLSTDQFEPAENARPI